MTFYSISNTFSFTNINRALVGVRIYSRKEIDPEFRDSSLSNTFSNSLLGPATDLPVQLESSTILNRFGSPNARNIFNVAVRMLSPYV